MGDGLVLPGSALGIEPRDLGPTGNVYFHPDGQSFSTHLNMVTDHPSGEGYAILPLLVPGQVNIPALLENPHSATEEQRSIARRWAASMMPNLPRYTNHTEAEKAESTWHDQVAPRVRALVAPYLGPVLSNQNTPPATNFKP